MRAIAAKLQTGSDTFQPLTAFIVVQHAIDVKEQRRRPLYCASADDEALGRFTSLHAAKNAIRRHFGIESRRLVRWTEEQR